MRVYISGAVTGRPTEEYTKQFNEAQEQLFNEGYEVINPVEVCKSLPDTFSHDDYMDIDKVLLSKCDAIYMLTGWESSEGAREEKEIAIKSGMVLMGSVG